MAKRGASTESDEVMTKCSKSYTSLDDVSCGFSGLFSLTDPVRIEAVHWRDNGCFWGCVQCRRKVDTKCSLHPDSGSKVYYRLRVLIRQGDVLLWLTAFDEIATIIVGTPASEYGSLDVLGRRKLVDSVVGLHFLVNVVKTVKSGFTNFAFAKIYPARTKAVFTPQLWDRNGSGTQPGARVHTCSTASGRSGTSRPPRDVIAVERFRNGSGWLCGVNARLDPFRNRSSCP